MVVTNNGIDHIGCKVTGNCNGTVVPDLGIHSLYGHQIRSFNSSIICIECELELEIPEIFTKSSPFIQSVYRLYLYSQLKESYCHSSDPDGFDGTVVKTDDTRIDQSRLYYSTNDFTVRDETNRKL